MTPLGLTFTNEQLAIISQLCPEGSAVDPEIWSHEATASLKSSIKSFCISTQGSRCCYCDRHLGTENHRVWDIDHIVPRSTHPHFTFEPRNLAASCVDCNLAKRDTPVLVNKRRKTYPKKSDAFHILHPYFDKYTDHILRDGYIYVGKTVKGKKTIYTCDLLRFAQKYLDWSNSISDDRFESDVDDVLDGGPPGAVVVSQLVASLSGRHAETGKHARTSVAR